MGRNKRGILTEFEDSLLLNNRTYLQYLQRLTEQIGRAHV